jgi:hypothetical protein
MIGTNDTQEKSKTEELVEQTILAGTVNPESWWITRHGTVLIVRPDVTIWVGGGARHLVFGVGMPPVFGKDDIAEIPISSAQSKRLWNKYLEIKEWQAKDRVAKALSSVGL